MNSDPLSSSSGIRPLKANLAEGLSLVVAILHGLPGAILCHFAPISPHNPGTALLASSVSLALTSSSRVEPYHTLLRPVLVARRARHSLIP